MKSILVPLLAVLPSAQAFVNLPYSPSRSSCDDSRTGVLFADTVDDVETEPKAMPEFPQGSSADAVICGGGPAGLLSAIMLAQKFPDVSTLWDCGSLCIRH